MISKFRKHFLKLFIGTVVSTAALLFFALRSEYVADRAHHYLVAYLEDSFKSRIEMGRPEIAWLRGSWYIKDVSIRPNFGKESRELLKAKSVRISFFSWWNVFKREIAITSVQIEDPVIYLRVEKNGIANLPSFDFLKGSGGLFRFTLREIRIFNGRLEVYYPDTPVETTFSNIDMRIRPDVYGKKVAFSLMNSSVALKIKDFTQMINSLRSEFSLTPEFFKIKSAELSSPEGKAFVDGFSLNFSAGKWDTKVTSTVNLASLKEIMMAQIAGISETFNRNLNKTVIEGNADISASLQGDKKGFEVKGEAKAGQTQLDGSVIRDTFFTFSARGKWNLMKETALDVDLRSKIPVELVRHYFDNVPQMKGVADLHLRFSLAGGPWSETGQKLKIDGDILSPRIETAGISAANVSARFNVDQERVNVTDAVLEMFSGSLKGNIGLDLKGSKGFKGNIIVKDMELNELAGQWAILLEKIPGTDISGKLSGNIELAGALLPELNVNVNSNLKAHMLSISNGESVSINFPGASADARFSYKGGVVRLRSVSIETPASLLSFTGDISGREVSMDFMVNSSNMNELVRQINASGSIKGRLSGDIGRPSAVAALALKKISWDRFRAESISGNVSFRDYTISSTGVSARYGNTEISTAGNISFAGEVPMLDARFESASARLEEVLSMAGIETQAGGDISLNARVKGVPKALDGEVIIKGSRLLIMGEDIDTVDVDGKLEKGRLVLQRGEILRDGDRLSFSGGTTPEGDLNVAVSSSPFSIKNLPFVKTGRMQLKGTVGLEGRITGSFRNPAFRGKSVFNGVEYRQLNLGNGYLDLIVQNDTLTASGMVFGFDVDGDMLLRGKIPFNIDVKVKDAPMAPYFKGSDKLEGLAGNLTGEIEAHGELANLKDVWAKLSVSALQLTREPFLLKNTRNIELELKNGRMSVNSFQLSGKGTELNASGWVWTDGETSLLITGSVDLYILQLFTKVIEKGAGVAEVKLTINGKPPRMEGEIFVKEGVIGIKRFDPVFRDITGEITLKGETLIVESMGGRIGEGSFKGGGTIVMDGLALKRTDISLDVSGLYLAYPRWLPSEVQGSLRLSGEYPSVLISGDMNVVKARYSEKVDWATFMPSFRQRLKEPETEKEKIGNISMDINFKADRNLIFDNNVGKGELKGLVKLKLDSGRFGILGQVEVLSGKVFYKEHEFKITSGVIEFPDPKKMEAVFDFTAEGKVRDYVIQILVQGNTKDFKVTMTSSPALSELDIASLLSLGLTSKEFQEGGGVAPAYGAASLLSREVESRFKDYMGFNRFHIDPYYSKITGTTEPKLTVGKDISDDVMVIYSRGLTGTGEQEVQMEYKLNRNFSVLSGWSSFGQSQSGDMGADIKYRYEFR